jgi:hypothetical protein
MKLRIIEHYGMFYAQYRTFFFWRPCHTDIGKGGVGIATARDTVAEAEEDAEEWRVYNVDIHRTSRTRVISQWSV